MPLGWYWYDCGFACGGIRINRFGLVKDGAPIFHKMKTWTPEQVYKCMNSRNNRYERINIKNKNSMSKNGNLET